MDEKQLRKEIYNLRKNLRQDIKAVRGDFRTATSYAKELKNVDKEVEITSYPTYALDDMRKLEKLFRQKAVRYMDKKELQDTYRDLRYIRNLKSSTVEGAREVFENFQPIADKLGKLDEKERKAFWDIYKYARENKGLLEHFKYQLFNELVDSKAYVELKGNEEGIRSLAEKIQEKFHTTYKGGDYEQQQISFTNALKDLLQQYR